MEKCKLVVVAGEERQGSEIEDRRLKIEDQSQIHWDIRRSSVVQFSDIKYSMKA